MRVNKVKGIRMKRVAGRRWNAEKYVRCPECLREIRVTNEGAIYLAFSPYGSLPHNCTPSKEREGPTTGFLEGDK